MRQGGRHRNEDRSGIRDRAAAGGQASHLLRPRTRRRLMAVTLTGAVVAAMLNASVGTSAATTAVPAFATGTVVRLDGTSAVLVPFADLTVDQSGRVLTTDGGGRYDSDGNARICGSHRSLRDGLGR